MERPLEVVEHGWQLERPGFDPAATRLEPAHIQQLRREPSQRLPLQLDGLEDGLLLLGNRAINALLHELQVAENHVDWSLELVRRDGDEFRLQLVEVCQLLAHVAKAHGQPSELVSAVDIVGEAMVELAVGNRAHALLQRADGLADAPR